MFSLNGKNSLINFYIIFTFKTYKIEITESNTEKYVASSCNTFKITTYNSF